jgi:flagellar biosynthesis/type III secretory pathway chaperone
MQSSTSSYENLITILEKEFALLSGMVELLQKEKDVITGIDISALNNHIRNKELVVAKINVCEEARERELKSLGLSGRKLSQIAAEAGSDYRDRLLSIVSRFKAITCSIAELNKLNSLLIEKSLFYIRSSSRFLETFGFKASGKVSMEV